MSSNKLCHICQKCIHGPIPLWLSIYHLVVLYVAGVYELFRQRVINFTSLSARKNPDTVYSTFQQVRPVVVLTGASSGIGSSIFQIIRPLAKEVVLLTHPDDVLDTHGHPQVSLDFNSRDSVQRAVVHLRPFLEANRLQQTILLIHCAGVYFPHDGAQTPYAESVQKTFAVNTVTFACLLHQLDGFIDAAVIIGSASHRCAPVMTPGICPASHASSPFAAYPASKALLLTTSALWSHRTRTPTIVIHPGIVSTNLYDTEPGLRGQILRAVVNLFAFKSKHAAARVLLIVERAHLLDPPAFRSVDFYWDAVTLQPGRLPAHLRDEQSATFAEWFITELDLR